MKKYYITGMSATGKSSVAQELKKRGITILDIDSLDASCNWYDKDGNVAEYKIGAGKQWLYDHEWRVDFDKVKKAVERHSEEDIVVVVGITSNQFDFLDYFDKVFLLQLDDETQIDRLNNRTTNDFAKDPEDQAYILETKGEFDQKMLDRGAIALDGSLPIEKLADKITAL